MIISHKHKFIFFKTGKCAGTSIETFLSQICGQKDICTNVSPKPEGHVTRNPRGWKEHDPAIVARRKIPNEFKNYFKLSVERNPWDKAVSQYWHHVGIGRNKPQFKDYIMGNAFGQWTNNGRQKYSIDKTIVVDYVMMYHNLQQELEYFVHDVLKLNAPIKLVNAKGNFRKQKGDYTIMYPDQESIDRIASLYAWEIEVFGFNYGGQFRK